jgi:predicted secreted protein
MVAANAATLWLDGDREIHGSIISADAHTLIIKRDDTGGIQQVARRSVSKILVEGAADQSLSGKLVGWSEGIYEIETDGRVALIRPGEAPIPKPTSAPAEVVPSEDVAEAGEETKPIQPEDDAPQQTATLDQSATAETTETPTTDASQVDVPTIDIKASPIAENGVNQAFDVKLSHQSKKPITLLYITVDDSATAGNDYEKSGGSITIEPGNTSAEVEIAIIDDEAAEGEEQFKLLVSADPNTAKLTDGYVTATINDDD